MEIEILIDKNLIEKLAEMLNKMTLMMEYYVSVCEISTKDKNFTPETKNRICGNVIIFLHHLYREFILNDNKNVNLIFRENLIQFLQFLLYSFEFIATDKGLLDVDWSSNYNFILEELFSVHLKDKNKIPIINKEDISNEKVFLLKKNI